MRPLGVLVSTVLVIGALWGTIWVARYSPWATQYKRPQFRWEKGAEEAAKIYDENRQGGNKAKDAEKTAAEKAKPADHDSGMAAEPPPPMSKNPPYPKAVTGERVHSFNAMGINEERKHSFHIENKGQAPLLLTRGATTCKCTISNLANREVPPGGSADIELSWTPRKIDPAFEQTAVIQTNDPELAEIQFRVIGKVVEQFVVLPERTWHAGQVTDVQEGRVTGIIGSTVDRTFEIRSVESSSPFVKVEYKPLGRRRSEREDLIAGYEFQVKVEQAIPVGQFRSRLRIRTTLEGDKTIDVEVTAVRSGPVLYLPPSKGVWNGEKGILSLGRFDRHMGHKTSLPVLVYDIDHPFELTGVECDDKFVKVTFERDQQLASEKQQGGRLVFEVPPDGPAVTRVMPDPLLVKLKTNHPKVKEMRFLLEYIAN
jgi:hypothetical protein